MNAEAIEENLEYRNICFDAVINALREDPFGNRSERQDTVSEPEEEKEQKDYEDVPMSPAYVIPDITANSFALKRKITRIKQTDRKSTGGKGPRRRMKMEKKSKGTDIIGSHR